MANNAMNELIKENQKLILKADALSKERLDEILEGSEMTLKEAVLVSRTANLKLISLAEASLEPTKGAECINGAYIDINKLIDNKQNDVLLDLIINDTIHLNGEKIQNEFLANYFLDSYAQTKLYKYLLENDLAYGFRKLEHENICLYDSLKDMDYLTDSQRDFYLYGYKKGKILGIPSYMVNQINHFNEEDRIKAIDCLIDHLKEAHASLMQAAKDKNKTPYVTNNDELFHVLLMPHVIYFNPDFINQLNVNALLKEELNKEIDSLQQDVVSLSEEKEGETNVNMLIY